MKKIMSQRPCFQDGTRLCQSWAIITVLSPAFPLLFLRENDPCDSLCPALLFTVSLAVQEAQALLFCAGEGSFLPPSERIKLKVVSYFLRWWWKAGHRQALIWRCWTTTLPVWQVWQQAAHLHCSYKAPVALNPHIYFAPEHGGGSFSGNTYNWITEELLPFPLL